MLLSGNRSTVALLLSSLLITIGRGATLPFMAVYLNRVYGMSVDTVGFALSVALTAGVLFGMVFGVVADRFEKKNYMLWTTGIFFLGLVVIPLVHNALVVIIAFSVINCAYTVLSTVRKSYFSDTLSLANRPKIFSLNYTFLNIGWTIGPPLGTVLMSWSMNMPFWLAAVTSALPFVMTQMLVAPSAPARLDNPQQRWDLTLLWRDRRLVWFTLSGFISALVAGSFATCISQYVLVLADSQLAQQVVAVVLPVNAVIIVSLQYMVGKRISPRNVKRLMFYGTLFFIIGLAGFIVAGRNLWLWGAAAAVFTLGELIFAPAEYMLIDYIAPAGMKSSYFSVQSLSWLGAALNPALSGLVLTCLPPWSLFVVLMVLALVAYCTILPGMRGRPLATLQPE